MLIFERLVASRSRTRCLPQSPCRCSSQPSTKLLVTAPHELVCSMILTSGRSRFSLFSLNFFSASLSSLAPLTTWEAPFSPTYCKIVCTWSRVGASSVMFSSNGSRRALASLTALVWALVDACFSRLETRTEAGELALWKSVIMSRVLRCTAGHVSCNCHAIQWLEYLIWRTNPNILGSSVLWDIGWFLSSGQQFVVHWTKKWRMTLFAFRTHRAQIRYTWWVPAALGMQPLRHRPTYWGMQLSTGGIVDF